MLRRRSVHKDMADFNGYTAKRLREMAESFAGLSKAFGGNSGETGLSREDGAAAMEAAAAMVCGSCEKCGIRGECRREDGEENYYLYYLLRTFEKKGAVDYEDMPRRFLETCRRKADYLGQLNRNLGRATMNLAWKSRFLESRDAVMVQFREMADILEEFSGQMEQAADVTAALEPEIRSTLWRRRVDMESSGASIREPEAGDFHDGQDDEREMHYGPGRRGASWPGGEGAVPAVPRRQDDHYKKRGVLPLRGGGELSDAVWLRPDAPGGGSGVRRQLYI